MTIKLTEEEKQGYYGHITMNNFFHIMDPAAHYLCKHKKSVFLLAYGGIQEVSDELFHCRIIVVHH